MFVLGTVTVMISCQGRSFPVPAHPGHDRKRHTCSSPLCFSVGSGLTHRAFRSPFAECGAGHTLGAEAVSTGLSAGAWPGLREGPSQNDQLPKGDPLRALGCGGSKEAHGRQFGSE